MLRRCAPMFAHKWASPPTPQLESIRKRIEDELNPVYFTVRTDISAGPWNNDSNFYGIICSPKFEGLSYQDMHGLVRHCLDPLQIADRYRFSLEPPSRWNRLERKKRWRWTVDK